MKLYVHSEGCEDILDHTFVCRSKVVGEDILTYQAVIEHFRTNYSRKHSIWPEGKDIYLVDGNEKTVPTDINLMESYPDGTDFFIRVADATISPNSEQKKRTADSKEKEEEKQEVITGTKSSPSARDADPALPLVKNAQSMQARGNFRKSREIWTQVVCMKPDSAEAWVGLGDVNMLINNVSEAAMNYEKAISIGGPGLAQILLKLGQARTQQKNMVDALDSLMEARELASSTESPGDLLNCIDNSLGDYWLEEGDGEKALQMYAGVLRRTSEQNPDALIGYAKVMLRRPTPMVADAQSALLRAIVGAQGSKVLREMLTDTLLMPEGLETLKAQLPPAPAMSEIYAFLSTLSKEYGALEVSLELQRIALEFSRPQNRNSYALNLVHGYENINEYQKAFDEAKRYLAAYPSLKVAQCTFTNADILSVIKDMDSVCHPIPEEPLMSVQWIKRKDRSFGITSSLENVGKTENRPRPDEIGAKQLYDDPSYDLMAIYFTIVKILFLNGSLAVIPSLVQYIEEARMRSKKDLHLTTIRNEHAYYCCIAQICAIQNFVSDHSNSLLAEDQAQPIYVCGDSHTLPASWKQFSVGQRKYQLVPALVTGMKHWHLHPESRFYPKVNFHRVIQSIPVGSKIIFIFGEIDCREGMIKAVDKCRYANLEEAMTATATIFIDVIKSIVEEFKFTAYIHPIIPILEQTRHVVKKYNRVLRDLVASNEECMTWLNFFDYYIDDAENFGCDIAAQYELDGTHLHPDYLGILQDSLSTYLC